MQENCHGAPQLNRQQNESARSTNTKFNSIVEDSSDNSQLLRDLDRVRREGERFRKAVLTEKSDLGDFIRELGEREVLNRPPNEAQIRGIR